MCFEMDITIIIPAFNEGQVIEKVIKDLKNEGFENLLVINDGSSDDTEEVIKKTGVNYISHSRNRGYGASLKTGILNAKTEYIAIYDGDGQHIPSELTKLKDNLGNFDMLVGARDNQSHQVGNRKLGKRLIKFVVNKITKTKVPDFNSGLRIFRRNIIKRYLHLMPDGFSFSTTSTVTLLKLNYEVKYIPITVKEREGRKSNVSFKDGFRTLMLVFNLSVLFAPLKIFIPASVISLTTSLIYFIIYSLLYRVHITSSMVLLFITGVLLFFMGILCEQISATRRELSNG